MKRYVYWQCHCSQRSGHNYWGPNAERKAVKTARRHWRKRHVEVGEQDTQEAREENGPVVREMLPNRERRDIDWTREEER